MKKLILLIMALLISAQAMATECTKVNGTEITSNNGTVYCKSNRTMNWWTALGWCQTIGKTPFRYPEDCRCIGMGCPETTSACPNLAGVEGYGYIWTATPRNLNPTTIYTTVLSSGSLGYDARNNIHNALCY